MRCEEARLALLPEPGPPLDSPEAREAIEHYEACGACQRFFQVCRRLARRLQMVGRRGCCPAGVAERTRAAVAREAANERDDAM